MAARFSAEGIDHFLPLYNSVRHWKDRRVLLSLPLFPGYVFVRTNWESQRDILREPGVSRFVGFNGYPVQVAEEEITALRRGLSAGLHVTPHPYFATGKRVRITNGPLAGLTGTVIRGKGYRHIVISLDFIQRSILTELDHEDLEAMV